jgi:hypothetical protein
MANPLEKSVQSPQRVSRSAQDWCDLANRRLAGLEPLLKGGYMIRRDVYWFVEHGKPTIGFVRDAQA